MKELHGHKVNPANDRLRVIAGDEPGQGGARHKYAIAIEAKTSDEPEVLLTTLDFQNGPIKEVGVNGVTHEALLAILVDRLEDFQSGAFACRENAIALTKLQEAQMWLLERTRGRMKRGVEGTHDL